MLQAAAALAVLLLAPLALMVRQGHRRWVGVEQAEAESKREARVERGVREERMVEA